MAALVFFVTIQQPQLATCDEETSILCILDEFTQLSITSLVTVAGVSTYLYIQQLHVYMKYTQMYKWSR